jgi:hypothetical protein
LQIPAGRGGGSSIGQLRAIGPPGEYEVPARLPREGKGHWMYIGVGGLIVILIIVLIVYFIRRS